MIRNFISSSWANLLSNARSRSSKWLIVAPRWHSARAIRWLSARDNHNPRWRGGRIANMMAGIPRISGWAALGQGGQYDRFELAFLSALMAASPTTPIPWFIDEDYPFRAFERKWGGE